MSSKKSNRDDLKRAIAENGGDRLESSETGNKDQVRPKKKRSDKAEEYRQLTEKLELEMFTSVDGFLDNRNQVQHLLASFSAKESELQNSLTEVGVEFRTKKDVHDKLTE